MREQSAIPTILAYLVRSVGIATLLILLSFAFAGFNLGNMSRSLAFWGALALLYGIWKLGTSAQADTGVSAVNDMRGQAGASPLANYANRQEYKLARLRQERPDVGEGSEPGAGAADEPKDSSSDDEHDLQNPACIAIAGVRALGLSWLAGQMFPR